MDTFKNIDELPVQDYFRLRGHNGHRMSGLSDGVYALAIAILMISSNVPTNFEELILFVNDLIPFGLCIVFIYWIWRSQSLWLLRFGMEDARTYHLNMLLLFFVLFYVYPLKFLMTWLYQFYGAFLTGTIRERFVEINATIPIDKLSILMVIYGVGFILIFLMLLAMYRRALTHRESLQLSPREIFETKFHIQQYIGVVGAGIISVILAVVGIWMNNSIIGSFLAGVSYNLIWVFSIFIARKKKRELVKFETSLD